MMSASHTKMVRINFKNYNQAVSRPGTLDLQGSDHTDKSFYYVPDASFVDVVEEG